jgi:glycosyltransferase involved in cell wall biosynthesis
MDDVRSLLWAADGFILTSRYEGMSLSMLEAISCGIPLLLTNAPGLAVMHAHGLEAQWLPNPAHSEDFAADVLSALEVWAARPAVVSLKQHEFIRRNFNATIQFDKIVTLYANMVEQPVSQPRLTLGQTLRGKGIFAAARTAVLRS